MPPRRIHNLAHYNVSLFRGRTLNDTSDAIAYSLFIIGKGRIGSRAEAEYLIEERARRQFRRLSNHIKSYKYEADEENEEMEVEKDLDNSCESYSNSSWAEA